jgi:hypothetical protein
VLKVTTVGSTVAWSISLRTLSALQNRTVTVTFRVVQN